MEKLEEEKAKAKLEISKKMQSMAEKTDKISIKKEPVSDEFEKKLVDEADSTKVENVESATIQPKSDLQKLQAELSAAALQSKKYARERQAEGSIDDEAE